MSDSRRVIFDDGMETWWSGDWHHRNDGPAVIYPDGKVEWWLNNYIHSFDSWCKAVKLSKEELVEIKLIYGDGIADNR